MYEMKLIMRCKLLGAGMATDQEIFSLCVEILDTFDDSKCGVEDHLRNFIGIPASEYGVSGGGGVDMHDAHVLNERGILPIHSHISPI
jgi:hypothetical protein